MEEKDYWTRTRHRDRAGRDDWLGHSTYYSRGTIHRHIARRSELWGERRVFRAGFQTSQFCKTRRLMDTTYKIMTRVWLLRSWRNKKKERKEMTSWKLWRTWSCVKLVFSVWGSLINRRRWDKRNWTACNWWGWRFLFRRITENSSCISKDINPYLNVLNPLEITGNFN